MLLNDKLPHDITNEHVMITFCGKGKCKCPSINMDLNRDKIIIGGKEEGYTEFTKEEFRKGYAWKIVNQFQGNVQ